MEKLESKSVLEMARGAIAERADYEMGKLAARKTIAEYIKGNIADAVADGRVVVMI